MVKKLQILCSSDHPILFKFRQFVVDMVIKVFWTSTDSNSYGNMEKLEREI